MLNCKKRVVPTKQCGSLIPELNPSYAGENGKSYAVVFDRKLLLKDSDSADSVAVIQKELIMKKSLAHSLGMQIMCSST